MDQEFKIIRGDSQRLRDRLEQDLTDAVASLASPVRRHDLRLAVLTPSGWTDLRPSLCAVSALLASVGALERVARDILCDLGWSFASSADAADYLEVCAAGLSNHRRIAGCRRIREAFAAARRAPPELSLE